MTKQNHTPGPWVADHHGHILAHGGTTNVASTWTTPDENYPEGRPYRANAALIASAPRLLDCTRRLLAEIDFEIEQRKYSGNTEDWWDLEKLSNEVHAAVADAEGRAA